MEDEILWSASGLAEFYKGTVESAEVGTKGKLLLVASDDGTFRGFDLSSSPPSEVFTHALGKPVLSCAANDSATFAVASTADGVVVVVDLAHPTALYAKWRRGDATVNDMAFLADDSVVLASADGCCTIVQINRENGTVYVKEELTGPDVDPLYSVRVGNIAFGDRGVIWDAGRDGTIRRY